jgi:hypothetical protein
MVKLCSTCNQERAVLRRPKTHEQVCVLMRPQQRPRPAVLLRCCFCCVAAFAAAPLQIAHSPKQQPNPKNQLCRECFFAALEDEVHQTIVAHRLFSPGERVAVAASGGKDSTVLAHMLTLLNARHG